jgi:hypothetical protein
MPNKILVDIYFGIMGAFFLGFVYFGFRWVFILYRMVDKINSITPPDKQLMYYGMPLLKAYWQHEKLFPEEAPSREDAKKCFNRTLVFFGFVIVSVLGMSLFLN